MNVVDVGLMRVVCEQAWTRGTCWYTHPLPPYQMLYTALDDRPYTVLPHTLCYSSYQTNFPIVLRRCRYGRVARASTTQHTELADGSPDSDPQRAALS
eukprot:956608-Rhodomonas_salina.1